MFLLRRLFAALIFAGVFVNGPVAAPFSLPPINGELAGKFKAKALPGTPEVSWKLRLSQNDKGGRRAEVEMLANGARLRINADLDANSTGTWEITESEFDAAIWLVILSPQLGSAVENLTASGKLKLAGSGAVTEGRPSGKVTLAWSDGSVRNLVQGWALDGVGVTGDLSMDAADFTTLKSSGPWELKVGTITTARFGARNLAVRAQLGEKGTVSLLSARVELAGGNVTVDPVTLSMFPPVLDLNVRVNRVGLQDLVALVPASLSDARGRIDGVVRLGWSKAAGFQVGSGKFDLRDDEAATLKLVSAPGFLTHRVPERLPVLPAWTGVIGRWMNPLNPVYGDVSEIELGRTELQIKSFALNLTPHGDERGRTAVVQITGRPAKEGGTVKLVSFEINVIGPVTALLKWSMEDQVSFEVK